ncbi:hypothetical protein KUTeg_002827 [Tegillarca granosa]|uniref:EF-hand domain-containing protein n=1 Tax=Tegillarca granosa TaxID=220873 RepID=A0ABQ9FQV1_TEGGR|nr:hypothetical protein KUTeg_002827 [Tegillarca granosa]
METVKTEPSINQQIYIKGIPVTIETVKTEPSINQQIYIKGIPVTMETVKTEPSINQQIYIKSIPVTIETVKTEPRVNQQIYIKGIPVTIETVKTEPSVNQQIYIKGLPVTMETYASKTDNGEKYMTYSDLIQRYLQLLSGDNYDEFTLQLFGSSVDTSRDGRISFTEFQAFEALLCLPDAMYALAFQIFDRNGNGYISFATLRKQEGKKNNLCRDFHDEHALQAFRKFDKNNTGFINAKCFEEIMFSLKSYLLTPFVRDNLITVALGGERHRKISYSYFIAFVSLLNNMELIKKIYLAEMLYQAQEFAQITPVEIDILFQLVGLIHQSGRVTFADLNALSPMEGPTGATAVYPIDLVKTRLQNQRTSTMVGELMYKNSFDCFKKMNDFMRDLLVNKDGSLPLWAEMVAGGVAGGSQVMFTNPLEIVKIRLQVAGEIVGKTRVSAIGVIKDLGFFGLYKGSRACFLRDIPFSAIYFPAYAHLKKYYADENGFNTPGTLLLSATIAARTGQTAYSGVYDCAKKIMKEEGFTAFWKGTPARVFRSSPQFGVTLLTYELLQRLFYVDFGGRRPEGSEARATQYVEEQLSKNPDHVGGYRLALATFDGMESKFGLCLPKFKIPT